MLNVRASDPVEFQALVDALNLQSVTALGEHLRAAGVVAAATSVPQATAPPAWATQGQAAPQSTWTPPVQNVQVGAGPPADQHSCKHGPRVYKNGVTKSGPKAGQPWAGYMCPQPQNSPDQCQPEWV